MDITVLISSSPIKSHPSTHMIDQCIDSVRQRLPHSRIIIMQDGVRPEQATLSGAYKKYIDKILVKYPDIDKIIMSDHVHQARMTRECLDLVKTPLILYMEHDTVLTGEIPFLEMSEMILSKQANVIRLMIRSDIPPEWDYLMRGQYGNYTKTIQWSQRPHLASTDFYNHLLRSVFTQDNKTYIEDRVYGIFANGDWGKGRIWIYTPEGDMQRSFTTDGREDAPKWDKDLVY